MALVPKIASANSTVVTSVTRPSAGARVASFGARQVDESSTTTDTYFDASPYEYTGGQSETRNDNHGNRQQLAYRQEHLGILVATSEVFAHLFEHETDKSNVDALGNIHQPSYPSVVSQAISTYELNSKVITGSASFPGTEISLTL